MTTTTIPSIKSLKGLAIKRVFTTFGRDLYADINWMKRRSEIKSRDGKTIVFAMDDLLVPEGWSQVAVDIAADKYLRKAGVGANDGPERSIRQMIDRVVNAIATSGVAQGGYFMTEADAETFRAELTHLLVYQKAAFNSPVWFNVGLFEAYGIKGSANGLWAWNEKTQQVEEMQSSYVRPQSSACFIQAISDDLMDIADFVKREMRLFKFGSGCASGDSLIFTTEHGLVSLRDVFHALSDGRHESNFDGKGHFVDVADAGVSTIALDVASAAFALDGIDKVWRYDVSKDDQRQVSLTDGTRVITSCWHPFMVWDGSNVVEKRADELCRGDAVIGPNASVLDLLPKETLSHGFSYDMYRKTVKADVLVDEEIGWLLGFFAGNGSLGKRDVTVRNEYGSEYEYERLRLRFHDSDRATLEAVNEIIGRRFNTTGSITNDSESKGITLAIYGTKACEFFASVYGAGAKTYTVDVPASVKKSPADVQLAFLAGMIDSDGSVSPDGRCSVSSSSESMARTIGSMSAMFRLGGGAIDNANGNRSITVVARSSVGMADSLVTKMRKGYKRDALVQMLKRETRSSVNMPINLEVLGRVVRTPGRASEWLKARVGDETFHLGRTYYEGVINPQKLMRLIDEARRTNEIVDKKLADSLYLVAQSVAFVEDVVMPQKPAEFYDLTTRRHNNYLAGEFGLTTIHNSGANFSSLRAEGERLTGGGASSGVMSFLDVFDKSAGAIKSGGGTRRAAKMVILDIDHPDIQKFIGWKVREEAKAIALAKAGFGEEFTSESYRTVSGQNGNNSVRVTDDFMNAVLTDGDWNTTWRTTGKVAKTFKAKELFRQIAESSWACADPGLQFDTTINAWHTIPHNGRIRGSNPCQPAWATVLTPEGIRTMGEIEVGHTIWSGQRWTKVTRKIETGVKLVEEFHTRAGTFFGTENHRIVQDGEKIEVGMADGIDISAAIERDLDADQPLDPQDIMDGLVLGDGATFSAMASLPPLLLVGDNDKDYFDSEVNGLFIEPRERFIRCGWQVSTTITRGEVPRTYERKIPSRFKHGNDVKVRGFLRGLYSANGSIVGGNMVTLKASSFDVIASAQEMLSSLGIRSYYTTNNAHDVQFENGTYTCKESYDLNVTVDRWRFSDMIGFIQKYKQAKLNLACDRTARQGERRASGGVKPAKTTFEIVSRTPVGMEPVFDITVDAEEHTYWTGGLLVSNCSEYMSIDESACNLASLNLMKFLKKNVTGANGSRRVQWTFDVASFKHACRVFTIAQEILVDYAGYPTREIAKNTHDCRQLGLGYANLGAMLMVMGIPYDSAQGRGIAGALTAIMTGVGYSTSAQIASSKGPFPAFAANAGPMRAVMRKHEAAVLKIGPECPSYLVSEAKTAWAEAVELGDSFGYRNSQAVVLAPTGTIGLLMDCDTTGIEPDYTLLKFKKLAGGGAMEIANQSIGTALETLGYGDKQVVEIVDYVMANGRIEGAPHLQPDHLPVFDCAGRCGKMIDGLYVEGERFIAPMGHVTMLEAVQPFVSGSISKTVNMPSTATVDEIEEIHMESWKRGLKCVAVYRDKSKGCQVLNSGVRNDEKEVSKSPDDPSHGPPQTVRHRLAKKRRGITQEFSVDGQKIYLRSGEYADGSLGEIFIDMHKEGATMRSMSNCFAILTSLALQHGVPLRRLVETFTFTRFEPAGRVKGHENIRSGTSILDVIFRSLAIEYMGESGLEYAHIKPESGETGSDEVYDDQAANDTPVVKASVVNATPIVMKASTRESVSCSHCGNITTRSGTCFVCTYCGTSSGCA